MTMHNISLEDGVPAIDMGSGLMDEDQFNKLAAEARREAPPPVPVFRKGQDVARVVEAVPNLPALKPPPDPARTWAGLSEVRLDAAQLARNGLFPRTSTDPAVAAFDILRARALLAMQDHGWRRIAVTSPTHGCGKSLVAANLALSFARRPGTRTVLIDLDLRRPGLAPLFGLRETEPLADMLTGTRLVESHLLRAGETLALGLNGAPVEDPGALIQSPPFAAVLDSLGEVLAPDLILFDLPPALVTDEVIALVPRLDAVLLVADGTRSTAGEVLACERLFEGRLPVLGVVLNRAQDLNLSRLRSGRGRR